MKYALVDGQRQEALPGRSGVCQACDSPMVARCGDVRVHHWAHRGVHACDSWWEAETEWHRNWKNHFPVNWQEVIHLAENGEKHIADVKTDQEWVLEFQHSKINPDERKSREAFYKKLVWVIDGSRRKRDKSQFFTVWENGIDFIKQWNLKRIPFPDECALLRDWSGSNTPVFFDFSGEGNKSEDQYLWGLIRVVNGMAYLGPLLRESFIKYHSPQAKMNKLDFLELLRNINEAIEIINQPRRVSSFDPLTALLPKRERPWRPQRRF